MTKRRLAWVALLLLWFGAQASAADIGSFEVPGGLSFIKVSGAIVDGDAEQFRRTTEGVERAIIFLQSPGGLIADALEIGALISIRGYATVVEKGGGCFSACGLIWVAGRNRYMEPDALIGFHAAYREEAGEYLESGVANAEIGSYLTHLGLRIEAIRFFTVAGPKEVLLLTPSRARLLGIDVHLLDESGLITPDDAPSGDRYAERWMLYNVLRSQCGPYLKQDASVIESGLKRAHSGGVELMGEDAFAELWLQLLDRWSQKIQIEGHVTTCVEAEISLRSHGQPTGVGGPSFSCDKAATPTEKAICSDPDLWPKDRAISAIYFWIRDNAESALADGVLSVQRAWLKARNECGGDRRCLNEVYDQRLQELKLIVLN